MKRFSTWKLLRKIQRIQMRGPFTYKMPLTIWTWNIPSLVTCLIQVRNREYLPGWIPPSPISCSHTLGHTRHIILPRYALWCFVCFTFIVLPPLLCGRPRDRCRPCDRLRRRWHFFFFSRASRQANPLEHSDITHFLPSHACIRNCYYFLYDPTLMHSLLLLPAFIPYLLILNCLV